MSKGVVMMYSAVAMPRSEKANPGEKEAKHAFVDIDRTVARSFREREGYEERRQKLLGLLPFGPVAYHKTSEPVESYILPAWVEFLASKGVVEDTNATEIYRLEEQVYSRQTPFLQGASRMFEVYLTALYGVDASEVRSHAKEFARLVMMNSHTQDLFTVLQDHDYEIHPLTANPEELVEGLAEHWKYFNIRLSRQGIMTRIRKSRGTFSDSLESRAVTGLEKSLLLRLYAAEHGMDLYK